MQDNLTINEGYTLDYLIPAFFVFIIGLLGLGIHYSVTLLFTLIAIALVSVRAGIEFDKGMRQIRNYHAIGPLKIGNWVDITPFHFADLEYSSQSAIMGRMGNTARVRAKSYTLYLKGIKVDQIEFKEFIDYKVARKTLRVLVEQFGLEYFDHIEDIRQQAQRRRRR